VQEKLIDMRLRAEFTREQEEDDLDQTLNEISRATRIMQGAKSWAARATAKVGDPPTQAPPSAALSAQLPSEQHSPPPSPPIEADVETPTRLPVTVVTPSRSMGFRPRRSKEPSSPEVPDEANVPEDKKSSTAESATDDEHSVPPNGNASAHRFEALQKWYTFWPLAGLQLSAAVGRVEIDVRNGGRTCSTCTLQLSASALLLWLSC
jgi:hypothetical protein